MSVWTVLPLVSFSEGVGWGLDGTIVLRFARSREKGLLALIADDAHRSSVLLGKAMCQILLLGDASIILRVPRDTYGLQLRDSLRTSLLVIPGALLGCLGSLSGGISKLSEGALRSATMAFRLAESREGVDMAETGGTYVTTTHFGRFSRLILFLVLLLAQGDAMGTRSRPLRLFTFRSG